MGNCQAADSATAVIYHAGGRVERLYWPVSASEVMRSNPGHYVALVIFCQPEVGVEGRSSSRLTRVKILRPKDTIILGHAYRLVTSEEVMKGLWAKRQRMMKKNESDSKKQNRRMGRNTAPSTEADARKLRSENVQEAKQDKQKPRAAQSATKSTKQWRPSLQSISEVSI
ncbi:hypothetical protein ACLOJK_030979 [Asimina triloba]